jgi:hypothetical protein
MHNPTTPLAPTRARRAGPSASRDAAWSPSDDLRLADLATSSSPKPDWATIALFFPDRSASQVSERWTKVLDPQLVKGSWTRAEDETIINFVRQFGTKSWKQLAELLPARIGKQCRERWYNALDPSIDRAPWTSEEDRLLRALHDRFGNKWHAISAGMPGRFDNSIKNRWHSSLARRTSDTKQSPLPSIWTLDGPKPLPFATTPALAAWAVLPGGFQGERVATGLTE